ncbi:MAG: adenylosuccinate lyase [Microgenomates group bacterium Gr01-1014_5]|nr:MAG: adenylosuccinate lyase [Microgenomates group bacterium Gr01-1014_5]
MPAWNELLKPPLEALRYLSPFTIKYGSDEMHAVWSEKSRALAVRDLWIATAYVQMEAGLVTQEQYDDLVVNREKLDIREAYRMELDRDYSRFTGHDIVAASREYGDKAKIGGSIIGKGETSEEPLSNSEILLTHKGIDILDRRIVSVLTSLVSPIRKYKDLICMEWTHLQAAEPTTVGLRLAGYAQDLLNDLSILRFFKTLILGKGIKGAVGTSASFTHMLEGNPMTAREMEDKIMARYGLTPALITTQTYPRKFALMAVTANAFMGQSAYKFANDLKILQSTPFGEWAEPRRRDQVGSFAMPHKENPNNAEGIKALARGLAFHVAHMWFIAADTTLGRGLEDSAGKRSVIPESFLAADEILVRMDRMVKGLQIREVPIARNLAAYGPFVAMEIILSELSRNPNVDRPAMHDSLREKARTANEAVRRGEPNPLQDLVRTDSELTKYLSTEEIDSAFTSVNKYIGDAPERCHEMADIIEKELVKTT